MIQTFIDFGLNLMGLVTIWFVALFCVGAISATAGWILGLPIAIAWEFIRTLPQTLRGKETDFSDKAWWVFGSIIGGFVLLLSSAILFGSDHEDMRKVRYYMYGGAFTNQPFKAPPPPVIDVKTEIRRYQLVAMRSPKHFYVTLKDVATSQVYQSMYVSKHCNSYATNKIGDEYNISVTTKSQGDSQWLQFNGLYQTFCGE